MKERPSFSGVMSYSLYEGVLADAINIFKFHGIRRLKRALGLFILEAASGLDADAIVPVPLSVKGLRDRGFNQSLLLAKILSDHSRIPLKMDSLMKIKETHPQIGLTAKERAGNLRGVFRTGGCLTGLRLLLIDDVMTTGATAEECASQLLRAGAADVAVLTLARASSQ
ncbi:MAG: ComF family protein [Nitrospirae bacterium]|nr:ComF family protein [Nitrospirota bacterium]